MRFTTSDDMEQQARVEDIPLYLEEHLKKDQAGSSGHVNNIFNVPLKQL